MGTFPVKNSASRDNCDCRAWWISAQRATHVKSILSNHLSKVKLVWQGCSSLLWRTYIKVWCILCSLHIEYLEREYLELKAIWCHKIKKNKSFVGGEILVLINTWFKGLLRADHIESYAKYAKKIWLIWVRGSTNVVRIERAA